MAKRASRSGLGLSITLWILTFACVAAAVVYQRMTGPTKPLRGTVAEIPYKLVRSENTDRDASVSLPAHSDLLSAILYYRRHGTSEPFTVLPMVPAEGSGWAASLPAQPAAGKLDYYLILTTSTGIHRIPEDAGENVVIRFKDPVPAYVLIPHVLMMFLALWIGLRAGVAALFEPAKSRRLAWITLGCLSLGGLFLGPVVQKYAFGAYWTGWPVGEDLTDTKTLVMWAGWLFAVIVLGLRRKLTWKRRGAVLLATVIMIGVYLVPHSLRGSTLDYRKLDEGVPAKDAIGTG
jgi:hypothetical protein